MASAFSRRLVQLRGDVPQRQLAEALGIYHSRVQRLEQSDGKIKMEFLVPWARFLSVEVTDLWPPARLLNVDLGRPRSLPTEVTADQIASRLRDLRGDRATARVASRSGIEAHRMARIFRGELTPFLREMPALADALAVGLLDLWPL